MRLVLLFLLLNFYSFSQIDYLKSFQDALNKAKKENKKVFVKYYGESCHHCQDLQKILDQQELFEFINSNFISFKINAEDLQEIDNHFIERYNFNISQIPYLFFFDEEANFIHVENPSLSNEKVLAAFKTALNEEQRSSNYPTRYANGDRNIIFLKYYTKLAVLTSQQKIVKQLNNDIWEYYKINNPFSYESLISLAKYIKTIDNGLFEFWVNRVDSLDFVAPQYSFQNKIEVLQNIINDAVANESDEWDLAQFEKVESYHKQSKMDLYGAFMYKKFNFLKYTSQYELFDRYLSEILLSSSNMQTKMYLFKQALSNEQSFEFINTFNVLSSIIENKELSTNEYAVYCLLKSYYLKKYQTENTDFIEFTKNYYKKNDLNMNELENYLNN